MFELKENQNTLQSALVKRTNSLKSSQSRSEKQTRLSILRHANYSQVLNWRLPQEHFLPQLEQVNNEFSLLLSLMDISDDPQWRNYLPHLCGIMRQIHNICLDTQGQFLSQLGLIPNYHERLIKVLYLNDVVVQEHFKRLIMLFLAYNPKYQTLYEPDISLGLIDCSRAQKAEKAVDYLWIVAQIQCRQKTVAKALKIAQECIQSEVFTAKGLVVLPVLTIASNFVVTENNTPILVELSKSQSILEVLGWALGQQNIQLRREALLLCNNLLAKSEQTARAILPLSKRINWGWGLQCQEQNIFEQLVTRRITAN